MLTATMQQFYDEYVQKTRKCDDLRIIFAAILPLIAVFIGIGRFQTHLSYVGRNNNRRAMYKLTNPHAVNKRLAFLSKPR